MTEEQEKEREKALRREYLELMLKAVQTAPDAFWQLISKQSQPATFAEEVIKGAEAIRKYING